jgi:hypothetical protein
MEKQAEFTIIPPAVVDAIKNNKCGVCGRPIKKISKEMKAHPKLACGICRAKETKKPKGPSLSQRTDSVKAKEQEKNRKKILEKKPVPEAEIADCLKTLANELYLWDMRAWNKYKDIDEVGAYIDNPMHKNSGSAHHCVERLKFYSVDKELIIQAIMSNPHIQYKDRIVPCMLVTHADSFEDNIPTIECEKAKKQGHYGGGICNKCNGEPEPLEFEVTTSKGNKVKVKYDRTSHNHFEFEGPTISETGYRSEFHGMGDLDIDDEKIPEMAKIMADRLEIDVEIARIAKEKKDKRAQNKKGKKK